MATKNTNQNKNNKNGSTVYRDSGTGRMVQVPNERSKERIKVMPKDPITDPPRKNK